MHRSGHGARCIGLVYVTGVGEFGMPPPTGTVGDSYGNTMDGSADGAYRTELVWRRKPFRDLRDLELTTFRWVSWRGLEESAPVLGPQDTGTDRNRVLCRPSGASRPTIGAEQKSGHIAKAQQWIAEGSRDDFILHSALDWNLVLDLAGGALSNCSNIQIYKSNNSAAQHWKLDSSNYTQGAIESYRFPHSVLGKPTGPEQPTAHGAYQNFQNGTAYWNRSRNATYTLKGCIRSKYNTEGGAEGWLGYPTFEERKLKNGASQSFENGQIHWHAGDNHAHATHGTIQSYWASQNWENGWLGYPTSDEQTNSKGASQQFQGGEVLYCKDGSTVPSIQAKWEELG